MTLVVGMLLTGSLINCWYATVCPNWCSVIANNNGNNALSFHTNFPMKLKAYSKEHLIKLYHQTRIEYIFIIDGKRYYVRNVYLLVMITATAKLLNYTIVMHAKTSTFKGTFSCAH